MDIRKLQRAIVDGLEDVKAQNIVVYNTEHLSALFERVIIASGTSNRQTKSLAASVRDAVRSEGFPVLRTEGEANGEWIIVDCGAAVVHVMQPAIREYYHLEEIWGDKPVNVKLAGVGTKLVKASEESAPAGKASARGAAKKAGTAKAPVAARMPGTPKVTAAANKAAALAKSPARKRSAPVEGKVVETRVVGLKKKAPATKTSAAKSTPTKTGAAKAPARKAAPARGAVTRTTGVKSSGAAPRTVGKPAVKTAAKATPKVAGKTMSRAPAKAPAKATVKTAAKTAARKAPARKTGAR
jgi:ribosome-associated protein